MFSEKPCCIVLPCPRGNASCEKQAVAACARKEIFLSESHFIPLGEDALRGRIMHVSAHGRSEVCCQYQL